jgi:hypothetical protein
MQHSNVQVSMLRHLFLWDAKLDRRWSTKHHDARRRKKGKLRRVKPPWKERHHV